MREPIDEALEIEAVESRSLYEDVIPALAELKAMDIQLIIASSLSCGALGRFLQKNGLQQYFSDVWSRDNANGIKAAPLQSALAAACTPGGTSHVSHRYCGGAESGPRAWASTPS